MKIGMILDAIFPPDPRVENEAVSLINEGHEVFLFCLTYGEQKMAEVINGIQVKRYLSNKFEYKLSALAYTIPLYTLFMQKKIKNFINKNNIQVLHIHDIRIAQAVFNANKKFQLQVVLDLHENRPEIMRFYPHLLKFPGKYIISPKKWKKKEEKFIIKSTKVVVVTPESKHEIIKRVPVNNEKIIEVPNTVRATFYSDYILSSEISNQYSNKFVLLYIGDTGLRRGLETVIKSINKIKNTIQNVKLVVVGKNSTDHVLKKLAKDLNIEEYIDFVGWKDQSLFQSYILSSDICISPLHRNLHHDTTYANKIFQYMSLGKPLLVSDAIAQKKLTEKTKSGLVHIEKDVEDFSNKILILYSDDNLRKELGENGKKFVSNDFSWEQTSKKLINLYDTLSN